MTVASRLRALLVRGVPALALAAAGLAVVPAAPASAAVCSGESGVTVLVDFNQLGGGVQGTCVDGGGGRTAASLFGSAGFPLTYASRQPGFVCRVSGKPTSDPCVNTSPANAYWSLWWSDGDAGSRWVYASLGANSLKIPDGGLVAWSWDEVSGNPPPSAVAVRPGAASQPEPSPEPSPDPDPQPGQQPTPGGGQDGGPGKNPGGDGPSSTPEPGSPSESASPGASPSDDPSASPSDGPRQTPGTAGTKGGKRDKPKPGDESASPSAAPDSSASPSEEFPTVTDPVAPVAAEPDDDGLPGWLAPALIVVLFAAAGGVLLLRRRTPGA